ncbi:hypothetical protein [Sutcliffiella sp. NC1]|uniref:hypothetical protein n=1 Tax=Sutcliffiella sp. NC1 TaxID=3004096 RepID=UPI0022DDE8B2|nr:hypothetical protein [Sutcliffiella sp. NC1]WBL16432.1 hypothetical protein O1A01_07305 [Sutcliffiella sp. NC1]
MRVFIYVVTNFYIFLISGTLIYHWINTGIYYRYIVIVLGIMIVVPNLIVFLLEKVLDRLLSYLFRRYEKRVMENYNLFKWMGELNWIGLFGNLKNIKDFDKNTIHNNFERIKKEIRKEYHTIDRLKSLQLYLEVKVESPKLVTLNSSIQTILIALITSSLVGLVNISSIGDLKFYLYLCIVGIVWILLLFFMASISKEMDKFKLLLKLVNECIKEEMEESLRDKDRRDIKVKIK